MLEKRPLVRPEDDQVRVHLVGDLEDHVRRIAVRRLECRPDALVHEQRLRMLQLFQVLGRWVGRVVRTRRPVEPRPRSAQRS